MQRFALAIAAVAVLAVAVGATAFAATSGDERIYACVNNGDGTVRIVAGADVACAKGFHKLSWSAENPPPPPVVTPAPTATPPPTPRPRYYARDVHVSAAPFTTVAERASCDAGDVATGGGLTADGKLAVGVNAPGAADDNEPHDWLVTLNNPTDATRFFTISVVCVDL